jgi:hypothetical protein
VGTTNLLHYYLANTQVFVRYINGTKNGEKPNVYFGNLDIGFEVPIKVITRAEATKRGISKKKTVGLRKGEELLISYGRGYWKRVK